MGRSNVGKSSLLNALARRRRLAHTSRTPGRTQMCNVFAMGQRYYLVDLPGYGYARLPKASRTALRRLLDDYLRLRSPAGVVWLLDVRRDPSPDDLAVGRLLAERRLRVLVALTRTDLIGRGQRAGRWAAIRSAIGVQVPDERCVFTSSRSGDGVPEIRVAIDRLVGT